MNHGIDTGFLVAVEVVGHPDHLAARAKLTSLISNGDAFFLAPQVLAEFIHVVTDPKRFVRPLPISDARNLAEKWWTAKGVTQIAAGDAAVTQFFIWHRTHGLGRKRILDTLLAATYSTANISSILTTNPSDFRVLGGFTCITP